MSANDEPAPARSDKVVSKGYLDVVNAKQDTAAESAAKREMRRLVDRQIAVKDRIEAFAFKPIESAPVGGKPVRRSVSWKISERVNAIESVDKEERPKVFRKLPTVPRTKVSGMVQQRTVLSPDELSCDMAIPFQPSDQATNNVENHTVNNVQTDEKDSKKMTDAEWETDVHVCFPDRRDSVEMRDSLGKYTRTPVPSMNDREAICDDDDEVLAVERADQMATCCNSSEPVGENLASTNALDDDSADEGVVMRQHNNTPALDRLTMDELNAEYQKIENQIQRISQEIDAEASKHSDDEQTDQNSAI